VARQEAAAIGSDLVASCHCLIPAAFKFLIYGWSSGRRRCAS